MSKIYYFYRNIPIIHYGSLMNHMSLLESQEAILKSIVSAMVFFYIFFLFFF
jgi:hypothetical protein